MHALCRSSARVHGEPITIGAFNILGISSSMGRLLSRRGGIPVAKVVDILLNRTLFFHNSGKDVRAVYQDIEGAGRCSFVRGNERRLCLERAKIASVPTVFHRDRGNVGFSRYRIRLNDIRNTGAVTKEPTKIDREIVRRETSCEGSLPRARREKPGNAISLGDCLR